MNPANPQPDITLENVVSDLSLQVATETATVSIKESQFFERGKQELELRGIGQDLEERKTYANRIYCLVVGWLGCMFILLLLQGFSSLRFHLSDSVIIAAIGATTINVLGMLYVVVNYLFPNKITVDQKEDKQIES